jgi:hypothetical protein
MFARATLTLLGIFMLFGASAIASTGNAPPPLRVVIDAHEAPELAGWARRARDVCVQQYPMIVGHLGGAGFTPPARVTIVLTRKPGVAWTNGDVMTFCAGYFAHHPDDLGAVVHELCHVVQHYPPNRAGWLVEGIADQVRWFVYEPADRRPHIDPTHARYTDGYRTTAAFLDWTQRTTDPQLVAQLNAALRAGTYDDSLFKRYTGTPLPELWQKFIASVAHGR